MIDFHLPLHTKEWTFQSATVIGRHLAARHSWLLSVVQRVAGFGRSDWGAASHIPRWSPAEDMLTRNSCFRIALLRTLGTTFREETETFYGIGTFE